MGTQPYRWVGKLALVVAGLLVAGVFGARWWLNRYLHGEEFRQLINRQTSAALHAQGEYMPVHWTGNAAYSDGFFARGLPGAFVRELRADQVRAELDVAGIFRRTWRINDIEVQRLRATLQTPTVLTASGTGAGRSSVELGPIRIREANIAWPNGEVRRVALVIANNDGRWEASGSGGELALTNWPTLTIEQFRLYARQESVCVADARLRLSDGGELVVNGCWPTDVTVGFAGVPVENWLPADWRGKLAGRARGECGARLSAATVTGRVELVAGKLEALPVLDRIALFTGTQQFRSLQLEKASAEFTHAAARLTVRNLVMETPGLLRVEGGCVVEDRCLVGEFDVGVAASALRWTPGARGRVFTTERGGYLWTKVKVTGPLDHVQEDLSGRLIAAAGTELIEGTKSVIEQGAQQLFDLLRKTVP